MFISNVKKLHGWFNACKGKKINDILAELGSVAEGVKTSKAICELANKLGIEVPVSNAIYEAVYTDITPEELLQWLALWSLHRSFIVMSGME